jgi:hypothetical protein
MRTILSAAAVLHASTVQKDDWVNACISDTAVKAQAVLAAVYLDAEAIRSITRASGELDAIEHIVGAEAALLCQ